VKGSYWGSWGLARRLDQEGALMLERLQALHARLVKGHRMESRAGQGKGPRSFRQLAAWKGEVSAVLGREERFEQPPQKEDCHSGVSPPGGS
jgi:hypothetical protein